MKYVLRGALMAVILVGALLVGDFYLSGAIRDFQIAELKQELENKNLETLRLRAGLALYKKGALPPPGTFVTVKDDNFLWVVDTRTGELRGYRFAMQQDDKGELLRWEREEIFDRWYWLEVERRIKEKEDKL